MSCVSHSAAVALRQASDVAPEVLGVVSHLNDRLASLPEDLQVVNGLECFLVVFFCDTV